MAGPFDFGGMINDTAAGATDIVQKQAAYNALNKIYGPAIAYDPSRAIQATSAEAATANLPNVLAAQQAKAAALTQAQKDFGASAGNPEAQQQNLANQETAGSAQRQAQFRGIQLLKASVPQGQDSVDPATFDKVVGTNRATLGLTDDNSYNAFKAQVTAPGGAQHLDTIGQALLAPLKVTGAPVVAKDAQGNSVFLNRDQYGGMMQTPLAPGVVPVAQQRADTGNYNALTRRAGESVQDFRARVYAANQAYQAPGSQAPAQPGRTLPGDNRPSADRSGGNTLPAPSTDLIHAGNPPGTKTAAPVDPLARWPVGSAARENVLAGANQVESLGTNFDNANVVAGQVRQQLSPYTTGAGSMLVKDLPGTVQNDLRHNLQTLTTQAATGNLAAQKNAKGSTGLGRVLQAEWNAFGQMSGNMAQDQTVGQLLTHLNLLQDTLANGYARSSGSFKSEYNVDSRAALGLGAAPARQGGIQRITSNAGYAALPKGTQYMAPDGNIRTKQ